MLQNLPIILLGTSQKKSPIILTIAMKLQVKFYCECHCTGWDWLTGGLQSIAYLCTSSEDVGQCKTLARFVRASIGSSSSTTTLSLSTQVLSEAAIWTLCMALHTLVTLVTRDALELSRIQMFPFHFWLFLPYSRCKKSSLFPEVHDMYADILGTGPSSTC